MQHFVKNFASRPRIKLALSRLCGKYDQLSQLSTRVKASGNRLFKFHLSAPPNPTRSLTHCVRSRAKRRLQHDIQCEDATSLSSTRRQKGNNLVSLNVELFVAKENDNNKRKHCQVQPDSSCLLQWRFIISPFTGTHLLELVFCNNAAALILNAISI